MKALAFATIFKLLDQRFSHSWGILHFISLNCQHLDLIKHRMTVCGDGDKGENQSVGERKSETVENEKERTRKRK